MKEDTCGDRNRKNKSIPTTGDLTSGENGAKRAEEKKVFRRKSRCHPLGPKYRAIIIQQKQKEKKKKKKGDEPQKKRETKDKREGRKSIQIEKYNNGLKNSFKRVAQKFVVWGEEKWPEDHGRSSPGMGFFFN